LIRYLLNTTWFNSLTVQNHKEFYKCIWDLWQVRLGLKNSQKNEICPGYASTTDNSFENEIIINVPVALSIMNSGFLWPVESWKEFTSGDLLEAEEDVTVSPR
jgi:hypothetical protein